MVMLNTQQQSELDKLGRIDFEWRNAKVGIEAQVRKMVQEQIEDIEIERARQVHTVFALGVPKSRINKEGLLTSDPRASDTAMSARPHLARIALVGVPEDQQIHQEPRFHWVDRVKEVVQVTYPDYHLTPWMQASPYPQENTEGMFEFKGTLEGVIEHLPTGWHVIEDGNCVPEDQRPERARYFIDGPLQSELGYIGAGKPMPLLTELQEWIKGQEA